MVIFLRIEHFEYIVEIAKTKSISLASERLNVSQPSISQALASFEEEIGLKIFDRSKIGTFPTERGKAVITKSREILNSIEELKRIGNTQLSLLNGRLSISSTPAICQSILPKTLLSFTQKYPGIEIELAEEESLDIKEQVLKGKLDLGIIAELKGDNEPNHSLFYKPILKCKMMICVGHRSPLATKKSISLCEAFEYPLICSSPSLRKLLYQNGNPKFLVKTGHMEAVKNIIAEGVAIGFFTQINLKTDPYVHMGKIIPLEIIDDFIGEISYHLIQLKTQRSNASDEFYVELQKEVLLF